MGAGLPSPARPVSPVTLAAKGQAQMPQGARAGLGVVPDAQGGSGEAAYGSVSGKALWVSELRLNQVGGSLPALGGGGGAGLSDTPQKQPSPVGLVCSLQLPSQRAV